MYIYNINKINQLDGRGESTGMPSGIKKEAYMEIQPE